MVNRQMNKSEKQTLVQEQSLTTLHSVVGTSEGIS